MEKFAGGLPGLWRSPPQSNLALPRSVLSWWGWVDAVISAL
ncbi:MAG: hypothetical protein AAF289_17330 [Cyanobacteria bacterium P01_A01_bin.135]